MGASGVVTVTDAPLLIAFVSGTSLHLEQDRRSPLPILGNGPPGTFVVYPGGLRVSLPTDQIVSSQDDAGGAQVGFGGMRFVGLYDARLTFVRVRELRPEEELSPARSHVMTLELGWVSTIIQDGQQVWPTRDPLIPPK